MLMPVHGSDHFLNWFVSHFRMAAEFPPEFTAIPLEDIDPYYQNKKVQKKKSIFSTAGALEVIREAITREKCSFFNIVLT